MRENTPVLLVFPVCDGEIILEKGGILSEKRHRSPVSLHRVACPWKRRIVKVNWTFWPPYVPPSQNGCGKHALSIGLNRPIS